MRYSSDLTEAQWELVKEVLQENKYRNIDKKKEQVNGIIFFVKVGCRWRELPECFGKWETVYAFYRRACLNGAWDKIKIVLSID